MRSTISNRTAYTALVFMIIVFFIIESRGLAHLEMGDEHTYIYMGKLISEGLSPYEDFFVPHPPVQIYIAALFYKIFGFNIIAFKLIPLISIIISALFIFLIMSKKYGNTEAIISCLIFLSSQRILLESTYFLGISLTTAISMAGLYWYHNKRYMISGLFWGIAGLTGLYSLIPFTGVLIHLFLTKKNKLFQMLTGFSVTFILINLLFILTKYPDYFVGVWLYHFLKPSIEGNSVDLILTFMKNNLLLAGTAILSFLIKEKRKLLLPLTVTILYFIFILSIRAFNYYFVIIAPFLAILGGIGYHATHKRWPRLPILVILIVLAAFSFIHTSKYLLNTDFIDFQSKEAIVNHINSNAGPGDTIFGDILLAPLISLLTEKPLAFNMVDNNALVFLSGLATFDEVIDKVKHEKTRFILVRPKYGVGNSPQFGTFLVNTCIQEKHVIDKYWGDIFIYDCSQI